MLDDDFGNANGPIVLRFGEEPTLVFGDTAARRVYAYPYDSTGSVGTRRVLGDYRVLGGGPDGATVDADGGVWSCVLRRGQLARLTKTGVDRVVDLPTRNPSDVAFGGADLSRLFVTSIAVDFAVDLGESLPPTPEDGWLMALDDLGAVGVPEARFRL